MGTMPEVTRGGGGGGLLQKKSTYIFITNALRSDSGFNPGLKRTENSD